MGKGYKLYTDSSIDSVHRVLLSRGFEPNYVLATHAYIGRGGILLELSQADANSQGAYSPQTNNEQATRPRIVLSGSLERITAFHSQEFNAKEQRVIKTNISLALHAIALALKEYKKANTPSS